MQLSPLGQFAPALLPGSLPISRPSTPIASTYDRWLDELNEEAEQVTEDGYWPTHCAESVNQSSSQTVAATPLPPWTQPGHFVFDMRQPIRLDVQKGHTPVTLVVCIHPFLAPINNAGSYISLTVESSAVSSSSPNAVLHSIQQALLNPLGISAEEYIQKLAVAMHIPEREANALVNDAYDTRCAAFGEDEYEGVKFIDLMLRWTGWNGLQEVQPGVFCANEFVERVGDDLDKI